MHDTGIGDQLVDPAERVGARRDHPNDLFLVADIDFVAHRCGSDLGCGGVGGVAVDVRAQHVAALGRQPRGDR